MSWQDDIKDAFNVLVDRHKVSEVKRYNPSKPVRIKVDGEYFITPKGKSLWYGIVPAKNALRVHLQLQSINKPRDIQWKEYRDYCEELYQEFLKTRVEFEYI